MPDAKLSSNTMHRFRRCKAPGVRRTQCSHAFFNISINWIDISFKVIIIYHKQRRLTAVTTRFMPILNYMFNVQLFSVFLSHLTWPNNYSVWNVFNVVFQSTISVTKWASIDSHEPYNSGIKGRVWNYLPFTTHHTFHIRYILNVWMTKIKLPLLRICNFF